MTAIRETPAPCRDAFAAIAIPAAHAQVVRGDQIVAQSNYVSRQQVAIPQISDRGAGRLRAVQRAL